MIGDSWKSSANQSMLIWKLTLYKPMFWGIQRHSELIYDCHKKMPKATRKIRGDDDDDVPLHGAINEEEARQYSLNLDNIITKLGADVQDEVPDAMKEAI